MVGERHERGGHVHREVGRQQRRREAADVGRGRGTRGRGQRVGRDRCGAGQVTHERGRVVVGEEADGGRGGRALAAAGATAATAAQQVGRVLAEQRVDVVGRGGRHAAAEHGQVVGRRGRRR